MTATYRGSSRASRKTGVSAPVAFALAAELATAPKGPNGLSGALPAQLLALPCRRF